MVFRFIAQVVRGEVPCLWALAGLVFGVRLVAAFGWLVSLDGAVMVLVVVLAVVGVFVLGSYRAWADAEGRAALAAEDARPASVVIDDCAREGNDLRAALAHMPDMEERERLIQVSAWLIGTSQRLQQKTPTRVHDFLDASVRDTFQGPQVGAAYFIALVDERLAVLRVIRARL